MNMRNYSSMGSFPLELVLLFLLLDGIELYLDYKIKLKDKGE